MNEYDHGQPFVLFHPEAVKMKDANGAFALLHAFQEA